MLCSEDAWLKTSKDVSSNGRRGVPEIIHEVRAKTLLQTHRGQGWFGADYNMNIYRGCQHRCIYCDSRSECYQIENFDDILVKTNAVDLLESEISRKRSRGVVGSGSMSDPYTPVEADYKLTRSALEVIANHGFSVHMVTKSDMVRRDIDILKRMNWRRPSVAFTLTTVDDELARMLEPGAPSPSRRLAAMAELAAAGVCVGVTLMPVLPFIEDTDEGILGIVEAAVNHGGEFIYPAFGVTLRDRQRGYYFRKLDESFPGLSVKYRETYGDAYQCMVPGHRHLLSLLQKRCAELRLAFEMDEIVNLMPFRHATLF